jgi:hypothetical protein
MTKRTVLCAAFLAAISIPLDPESHLQAPYQREQQALQRLLKAHHKVGLEWLEVLDAKGALKALRQDDPESAEIPDGGLRFWTRVRESDAKSLNPFLRALRSDLILKRAFPAQHIILQGWRLREDGDLPDPVLRLGWELLSVLPSK